MKFNLKNFFKTDNQHSRISKIYRVGIIFIDILFVVFTIGTLGYQLISAVFPDKGEIVDDGIVIINNDDYYIQINNYNDQSKSSYSLDYYVANNTKQAYTIEIECVSVNNVQINNTVSVSAESNSSYNTETEFTTKKYIGEFTDLNFNIIAYQEDENGILQKVYSENVYVYPKGEENAENHEIKLSDTDYIILDEDNLYLVMSQPEIINENENYYMTMLYFKNNTDEDLSISLTNLIINDYEFNKSLIFEADSGNSNYKLLYFYIPDEYNIGDIEKMTLILNFNIQSDEELQNQLDTDYALKIEEIQLEIDELENNIEAQELLKDNNKLSKSELEELEEMKENLQYLDEKITLLKNISNNFVEEIYTKKTVTINLN